MMEFVHSTVSIEETVRKCDVENVKDELFVFRVVERKESRFTASDQSTAESKKTTTKEGFCGPKGLKLLQEGFVTVKEITEADALVRIGDMVLSMPAIYLPDKVMEVIEEEGFNGYRLPHQHSLAKGDWNNPYSDFISGQNVIDNVVFYNAEMHWGQRADGKWAISPIYFDDTKEIITNLRYDLRKTYEILAARSDIGLPGADFAECLDNIPGYNATEDEKYFLSFKWYPDQEQLNALMNTVQDVLENQYGGKLSTSMALSIALLQSDPLGLVSGGAARTKDFLNPPRYGDFADLEQLDEIFEGKFRQSWNR